MLFAMLPACITPNYALNAREELYLKNNKNTLISYDKKAIRHLKTNGIYTINFSKQSCSYVDYTDTLVFKAKAMYAAADIARIMNFKEHYQYIDVIFSGNENRYEKDAAGEIASCSITVRVPINNVSQARIRKSFNTYVPTYRR